MKRLTLFALAVLIVASLACVVPEAITNIDPTAVAAIDPELVAARARNRPYLNAHPLEYCPGETVTVEWYGGNQLASCSTYPLSVCRFVHIFAGAVGYSELFDSQDLEGSVVLTHLEDSRVRGATIFLDVKEGPASVFPIGETVDWLQMNIQEANGDHLMSQWFELTCDPASNTWQWSSAGTDTTIESSCMGIVEVCAQFTAAVSAAGSEPQTVGTRGSGTCSGAGVTGYHPDDVEVEISSMPGYEIVGQPCSPEDTLPEDLHPYYLMSYSMACMPLGELHGSAQERCSANLAMTVRAPILSDGSPAPTASGIHTICNLQATCGNAVCEPECENDISCPADCTTSTQGGACFDTCDPDEPASCLAGLSCLPRVAGGDEYICYNEVICNPSVTQQPDTTQQPCACGDGVCEQSRCSEFQQNCPADCGQSQPPQPPPAVCGDGACNGGETCWSCSTDCGPC